MKRPREQEAARWLTQAKDELEDEYYIPTRYPNSLPGGVPSRFFDDPKESEEAMLLARAGSPRSDPARPAVPAIPQGA